MTLPIDKQIEIAQKAVSGMSQLDIAKQYNVDRSTISRTIAKDDIRALVEQLRQDLITECGQKAKENIVGYIHSTDPDDKEYKYKASIKVMESIGALASHTQAVTINQLYQDNRSVHLSDASRAALDNLQAHVIEADPFDE
jgi:DNA-binding XRE family transcriptional regulator